MSFGYAGTHGCRIVECKTFFLPRKHTTGLRFLTVTEGTGYEIMSVGRGDGSYSPKPTLVRNTARPGSMGPELRTDQ
jgi:hypothetical protein